MHTFNRFKFEICPHISNWNRKLTVTSLGSVASGTWRPLSHLALSHMPLSNFSHRRYHSLPTTTKTRIKSIRIHFKDVCVCNVHVYERARLWECAASCFFYCWMKMSSLPLSFRTILLWDIQNYSKTLRISWHTMGIWHTFIALFARSRRRTDRLLISRFVRWMRKEKTKTQEPKSILVSSENCMPFWFNKTGHLTRWKHCHF